MGIFKIPYKETNLFSDLIIDYIEKDDQITSFINHFPILDKFKHQIKQKANHNIDRISLVDVLNNQNKDLNLSDKSKDNINRLQSKTSFTITTGHQTCLFTGPLFVIYKIISTINLANKLKARYLEYDFIPVFWMASEDHDLQEINHVNCYGKKILWDTSQSGAIGRMELHGIKKVLDEYISILGINQNDFYLRDLFKRSYLDNRTLSEATRYFINEFFGKYGLVIIDGDDKKLKNIFIPVIKKDILQSAYAKEIRSCSDNLAINYKAQAFIRDINFFKLGNTTRDLITKQCDESEINKYPEKFSPNVLLRPLYQEYILPNIAVIGGGSELSYWMQLKSVFDKEKIPFPILTLRNSVMLISDRKLKIIKDLGFSVKDIFQHQHVLEKKLIFSNNSTNVFLSREKEKLISIYNTMIEQISDKGLQTNLKAQLKKQLNFLVQFEKKLMRLEKKKYATSIRKIKKIKQELFPNNILQERHENFIPFFLENREKFIQTLIDNLNPLDSNFVVLSY